jgi:hypothetical protein
MHRTEMLADGTPVPEGYAGVPGFQLAHMGADRPCVGNGKAEQSAE